MDHPSAQPEHFFGKGKSYDKKYNGQGSLYSAPGLAGGG